MPKQLSEAAAWRKLAEWCAKNRAYFLCYSLSDWAMGRPNGTNQKAPFRADWEAMHQRATIHAALGRHCDWEFGPSGLGDIVDNSDARVMFCLFMALEAKEDAKWPTP